MMATGKSPRLFFDLAGCLHLRRQPVIRPYSKGVQPRVSSMPSAVPHRRVGKRAIATTPAITEAATWPALLLFGSGAASLVYQLLWIKQLSLVVGVEVYAVTVAVSAFFAGLAIGGA